MAGPATQLRATRLQLARAEPGSPVCRPAHPTTGALRPPPDLRGIAASTRPATTLRGTAAPTRPQGHRGPYPAGHNPQGHRGPYPASRTEHGRHTFRPAAAAGQHEVYIYPGMQSTPGTFYRFNCRAPAV